MNTKWFVMISIGLLTMGLSTSVLSESIIVDLYMGEPIPMEMMIEDLAQVGIIYLGEIHTITRHHRFQKELIRQLSDRGSKLAIGMEMFSIDQQHILDEWQKSDKDVSDLIRNLGRDHWTNLNDYADVLLEARKQGIPLIALNAPDQLVKKVARQGLSSLSDKEKELLPTSWDVSPEQDKLLRLRLRVHKSFQDKALDSIVQAQVLRDEIMASTILNYLNAKENTARTMLVIAGTGHLNYGLGIPERVSRGMDMKSRIILVSESGELVLSEQEKRMAVPVSISHEDLKFIKAPIADYLHILPLKEEPNPAPDPMDIARNIEPGTRQ